MIEGFETETAELTDYEKDTLLPLLVKGLNSKIGVENAITNCQIVKSMTEKGYKISSVRVRKIINYIRIKHLVYNLVSSSKGYYRSTDPEEIRKYVKSLMQRATAIEEVAKSFIV